MKTKTGVPNVDHTPGSATWRVRWTDDNGRRCAKTGFATPEAAHAWHDETIVNNIRVRHASDITLHQFAAFYLEQWEAGRRDKTIKTMHAWLKPALKTFGNVALCDLQTVDIAAWQANLPTPVTRHYYMRAFRQVLHAAVRWQYLDRNPAAATGVNKMPKPRDVQPFTREEITRLLWELDRPDAAIVVLASETGLRTSEWCGLEWADIDPQSPAVRVTRGFAGGKILDYPKTGRRRVPLTPRALEALDWVRHTDPPSPIVFPARRGRSPKSYRIIPDERIDLGHWNQRTWKPAFERSGVEYRSPYHLRHTFATRALDRGVSIYDLSRVMGATVDVIGRHYAGFTREAETRVRDLLSQP